ncbi:lipoprotein [Halomonas shantousis]
MKLLALAAIAAMTVAGTALAQPDSDDVALTTQQAEGYGTYVADFQGRTLYLFTTDTQGQGDAQAASTCHDKCAEVWPPLLSVDDHPQADDTLQKDLLGTFQREDGQTQVTYGGWPLYYFAKDQQAGDVNGQDVHGFGGEWYLVAPDGTKNTQQKGQ